MIDFIKAIWELIKKIVVSRKNAAKSTKPPLTVKIRNQEKVSFKVNKISNLIVHLNSGKFGIVLLVIVSLVFFLKSNSQNNITADNDNQNSTNSFAPSGIDTHEKLLNKYRMREEIKSQISNNSKKHIARFFDGDFDFDGQMEGFALVTDNVKSKHVLAETNDGFPLIESEFWFGNISEAFPLHNVHDYYLEPEIIELNNCYLLSLKIGEYVTDTPVCVWGVKNGKPVELLHLACGLEYVNNNDFTVIDSAYDISAENEDVAMAPGHSFKKYYLYWDGSSFREYGGLEISLDTLKTCKGAQAIINEIYAQASNVEIKKIFFRENFIININYTIYDNGIDNENVTLLYADGAVFVLPATLPASDKWAGRSTDNEIKDSSYSGIYKAAWNPDIATYPVAFG